MDFQLVNEAINTLRENSKCIKGKTSITINVNIDAKLFYFKCS